MAAPAPAPALHQVGGAAWVPTLGDTRCLRTTVIPLEAHPDFVEWALDGGALALPEQLQQREHVSQMHEYSSYVGEDDWGEDVAAGQPQGEEPEAPAKEYDFSSLISVLDQAVKDSEGQVFTMSDTRAPFDATWCVSNGEHMQCQDATEIVTMLKASSLCTSEWEQRRAAGLPLHICLRKWYSLDQGMCFRCFVDGSRLVGVSQKRLSEFFPFLPEMAPQVGEACAEFAAALLGMEMCGPHPRFSYDVYLMRGKRTGKLKTKFLGFHTWEEGTFLFSEECLTAAAAGSQAEVRVIEDREDIRECGVAQSLRCGIPEDLKNTDLLLEAAQSADLQATGGEVQNTVENMIKMMQAEEAGARNV